MVCLTLPVCGRFVLLLQLVVFFVTVEHTSSAIGSLPKIVTGRSGYALYMDARKPISVQGIWNAATMPGKDFTLELTVKIVDPHHGLHLFSYAAFDTRPDIPFDNANALVIRGGGSVLWFCPQLCNSCRASTHAECGLDAFVWKTYTMQYELDADSKGLFSLYVDGEPVITKDPMRASGVLPSGGCIVLGTDQDSLCGGFSPTDAFTGMIDEVRLWGGLLTADEIKSTHRRAVDYSGDALLRMAWLFESPDVATVADDSGNSNVANAGTIGSLNGQYSYSTTLQPATPVKPRWVAPKGGTSLIGSGLEIMECLNGETITVELIADSIVQTAMTLSIISLPGLGTISQFDGSAISSVPTPVTETTATTKASPSSLQAVWKIKYTGGNGLAGNAVDSFTYQVADGINTATGTVKIHTRSVPTPESITVEVNEDSPVAVALGTVSFIGEPVTVKINSLPDKGKLYHINETASGFASYATIEKTPIWWQGEEIQTVPYSVSNRQGSVVYVPDVDGFSVFGATSNIHTLFIYSFETAGIVSSNATVSIKVISQNDPPTLASPSVYNATVYRHPTQQPIEIKLESADVDKDQSVYLKANLSNPFYYVSKWPEFGDLIDSSGNVIPNLEVISNFQYGYKIKNASSHFTFCGVSCYFDYGLCKDSCTDRRYMAEQILGLPDVYPTLANSPQNWAPIREDLSFVEIELESSFFLTGLSIFETLNPGTITFVGSSPVYDGLNTKWSTVWAGDVDFSVPLSKPREFSPPLCPPLNFTKFIRIETKTKSKPGDTHFDAIRASGLVSSPHGLLKDGKLYYRPAKGVLPDSGNPINVGVRINDCAALSKEYPISIFLRIENSTDVGSLESFSTIPRPIDSSGTRAYLTMNAWNSVEFDVSSVVVRITQAGNSSVTLSVLYSSPSGVLWKASGGTNSTSSRAASNTVPGELFLPSSSETDVFVKFLARANNYTVVVETNFNADKASEEGLTMLEIALITAACFTALVVVFLIVVCYLKRKYERQRSRSMPWKIELNDLSIIKDEFESSSGISSLISESSWPSSTKDCPSVGLGRLSDVAILEQKVKNETETSVKHNGKYKGEKVLIKHLPSVNIILTFQLMEELYLRYTTRDSNLAIFVGAYFESCPSPRNLLVTQFYSKGALIDTVNNDKFNFELRCKVSILMDILNGLRALWKSEICVHGNLKSSNCLIDDRWSVKLSNFGLASLRNTESITRSLENEHKARKLFWTAPEYLIIESRDPLVVGTVPINKRKHAGDLFSFGVIISELLNEDIPYGGLEEKETFDVLLGIAEMSIVPVAGKGAGKGNVKLEDDNTILNDLVNIMNWCTNSNPAQRTSVHIKKILARHQGGKNITDNMAMMLEQYSRNLEHLIDEKTKDLALEKELTERLLCEMLPVSIAKKLKLGKAVEPETFECVTIFFSDIVGFTSIASQSTPIEIVNLLNKIYTQCDTIISSCDVYKVETIGDAYMVVSGLPMRNGDRHAGEIASMALLLLSSIPSIKPDHLDAQLQIRIGINSGPCAAGVVGITMPRYCLFGDTVNVASRMESSGLALHIQISESTKLLLDSLSDEYLVEGRGEIEIKGKGMMNTWWLVGKKGGDFKLPDRKKTLSLSEHNMK
eukprot:Nk52_evm70s226 gene=Nk52_evmTU70s226